MADLGYTFATVGSAATHVSERVHAASGGASSMEPVDPIFFGFMALLLGVFMQQCLNHCCPGLPYTVAILVLGIFAGCLYDHMAVYPAEYGRIYHSFKAWLEIDAHLILYAFLPALLFGDSMGLNFHLIKKCFFQCLILAGPGVAIGGVLVACMSRTLFENTYWTWNRCLMFGSVLAATDPVAVVGILKSLGVSPKLTMIIAGESLMNDGVAIVMYLFFEKLSLKEHDYLNVVWEHAEGLGEVPELDQGTELAGYALQFFLKVAVLGVLFGLIMGLVFVWWMASANQKSEHSDMIIQVVLSLCCAYLSFFIGEGLLHVSGVLATVVAAVLVGSYGWPYFTSRRFILEFWHTVDWLFNTILFFLSGAIMGHLFGTVPHLLAKHVGVIFLLYIGMTVIRGLLVGLFFFPLSKMGYSFTSKDAIVLTWGGLRGAVGLALAIDIFHKFYVTPCCPQGRLKDCVGAASHGMANATHISSGGGGGFDPIKAQEHCPNLEFFACEAFLFIAVYALLTLIINGTTTGMLLKHLGMMTTSSTQEVLLHFVENAVRDRCVKAFRTKSLFLYQEAFSEELKQQVRGSMSQLKNKTEAGSKTLCSHQDSGKVLKDVALLFFRILRNEYFVQADEGLIRDDASAPLLEAADQTIEEIKAGAQEYCDFSYLIKFLGPESESPFLSGLLNYTFGLCRGPIYIATRDAAVFHKPQFSRRWDQSLLCFIIAHTRAEQKFSELLTHSDTQGGATEVLMAEARRVVGFSQDSTQKAMHQIVSNKGELDDKKAEQVTKMLFEEAHQTIMRFQESGVLDATQAHTLLHNMEHEMAKFEDKLGEQAEKDDVTFIAHTQEIETTKVHF